MGKISLKTKITISDKWYPHTLSDNGRIVTPPSACYVTGSFLKVTGEVSVQTAPGYPAVLSVFDGDFRYIGKKATGNDLKFYPNDREKYVKITLVSPQRDLPENIAKRASLKLSGLCTQYETEVECNASLLLKAGPCSEEEMQENADRMNLLEELLSEGNGGTVFFDAGEYWFPETDYIELRSDVSVKGQGMGKTVFKKKAVSKTGSEPLFDCKLAERNPDYPIRHFEHSDFTVDCSEWETETGGTSLKAYQGYYCQDALFHHIEMIGTPATAFGIDYCHNVVIRDCIFKDCGRYWGTKNNGGSNGVGIMTGTWEEENVTVTRNLFENCGRHAVFFERKKATKAGKGQVITDNIIRNGRWCGIGIYTGDTVLISGNRIENCRGAGILLKNEVKKAVLSDNTVQNCGTREEELGKYGYRIAEANMGGIRMEGAHVSEITLINNCLKDNAESITG